MKRQRFKMCFRLSEPHKCLNHWYLQCLVMIFFSHHLPWSPVLIFLESNVCGIYPWHRQPRFLLLFSFSVSIVCRIDSWLQARSRKFWKSGSSRKTVRRFRSFSCETIDTSQLGSSWRSFDIGKSWKFCHRIFFCHFQNDSCKEPDDLGSKILLKMPRILQLTLANGSQDNPEQPLKFMWEFLARGDTSCSDVLVYYKLQVFLLPQSDPVTLWSCQSPPQFTREVCGSASASAYIGGMPAVLRQLEQPARAILFECHQQVLLHHSLCSVACFSIFSSATFHYISISILSWLVFPLYCLAWKWART